MTFSTKYLPKPMTKNEKEKLYKNLNDDTRKLLVESNIRFALSIANSFKNSGIEKEDLIMMSMEGLVKAAKDFNHELGYDFSTYAGNRIKGCIANEIRNNKRHPYPKKSLNEKIYLDDEEVNEICNLIPGKSNIEDEVCAKELINIIKSNLKKMNNNHRKIVMMIINGNDRKDIAVQMGCSQSNVGVIFKRFKDSVIKDME